MRLRALGALAIFATLIEILAVYPAVAGESKGLTIGSKRIFIVPSAGTYLPMNSKVKDLFGSSWNSVGIGVSLKGRETDFDKVKFNYHMLSRNSNGNKILMIPLGFQFKHRLTDEDAFFSPYVGLGTSLYLARIKSIPDGINTRLTTAGGASLLFGADIGPNLSVDAAYHAVSQIKGFDFSGLQAGVRVRF
jgi:hypothetical protein